MRTLGLTLIALVAVLGVATETGAYGERRMPPRKPIPMAVRARGGLPPVAYYGRPLYSGFYGRYGHARYGAYGLRGYYGARAGYRGRLHRVGGRGFAVRTAPPGRVYAARPPVRRAPGGATTAPRYAAGTSPGSRSPAPFAYLSGTGRRAVPRGN